MITKFKQWLVATWNQVITWANTDIINKHFQLDCLPRGCVINIVTAFLHKVIKTTFQWMWNFFFPDMTYDYKLVLELAAILSKTLQVNPYFLRKFFKKFYEGDYFWLWLNSATVVII